MVVICGEFLNMILDIFKFHGVDIHSEFLQMFNSTPVKSKLIVMCAVISVLIFRVLISCIILLCLSILLGEGEYLVEGAEFFLHILDHEFFLSDLLMKFCYL